MPKKVGRPSTYNPLYAEQIIQFFSPPYYIEKDITITKKSGDEIEVIEKTELEPLPPKFLSDFARTIGVPLLNYRNTFKNWAEKYPEFLHALKVAKDLEQQRFITNGAMDLYHASFSMFSLKNITDGDGERWKDSYENKLQIEGKIKIENVYEIVESIHKDVLQNRLSPAFLDSGNGVYER